MDFPEFDLFVEDDGFEPELDFELDAEFSMSSSRVDESQNFFDTDSDFDLLDGTELSPLFDDSENAFEMELDLEEAESVSQSDSEMSVDIEFDTFLRTSKGYLFLLTKFSCRNSPSVVRCIEDMVLSFLTQLAHPDGARTRLGNEGSDSDSCPSPASKTLPKIELSLVNRSKGSLGRYVDFIPSGFSLVTLSSPAMKVLRYPKKTKTGSLKPFGE